LTIPGPTPLKEGRHFTDGAAQVPPKPREQAADDDEAVLMGAHFPAAALHGTCAALTPSLTLRLEPTQLIRGGAPKRGSMAPAAPLTSGSSDRTTSAGSLGQEVVFKVNQIVRVVKEGSSLFGVRALVVDPNYDGGAMVKVTSNRAPLSSRRDPFNSHPYATLCHAQTQTVNKVTLLAASTSSNDQRAFHPWDLEISGEGDQGASSRAKGLLLTVLLGLERKGFLCLLHVAHVPMATGAFAADAAPALSANGKRTRRKAKTAVVRDPVYGFVSPVVRSSVRSSVRSAHY